MRWSIVIWLLFVFAGCSEQPHFDSHIEYPIVTHYPASGEAKADRERQKPPGWGRYSAVVTDHNAPSWDRVVRSVRRWEKAGECPVDVYNHLDSLKSGVARMQVVNNVVIGKTLWTFFVGPNWKRESGPYVFVVSGRTGTSSNNSTAYGGGGPLKLPEMVAEIGVSGHPFIAAFVNQGGRESQGNHPDAMKSIGEGIAFSKAKFNVDDQNVVFTGKSRGGVSALMWGANPLDLNYKTAGIFAHATLTDYGTVCYQPNGTFPQLGSVVAKELTGQLEWMAGAEHEAGMQVLRDAMAGSQDPDTMRLHSPIAHIERFRDVYLAVGWGTHDPSLGPSQGFDFCQALDRAGVSYYAEFTLGGEHRNSQGVTRAFEKFMLGLVEGKVPTGLPVGRMWNRQTFEDGKRCYHDVDNGSPIWTILPQVTTAMRDNAVYVGAPEGSEVYLWAVEVSGKGVWVEVDTTVALDYVRVNLPPPPVPGRYRWVIAIGNIELENTAHITDGQGKELPPETVVLKEERFIDEVARDSRTFGHAWVWPF